MKHEQSCKNKIVKCVHCNKETDEKLKHEENCIDYYKTMFKALKNENEELCKSSRSSLISNSLIKSNIDANFEIRLNREESKSNEQFKIIEEKEEEISELKPEEVESNNTFTNWLKEGKAEFKNINIQIKGKESMIFASKTFSVDEEIMFIPSKLIITFDKIKKEKIFSKINFSHLNIPQQIGAYTIFLIIEKKKKESFWSPYINILSDDFYSIGLFFEDYELHWLRGSTLFEEIRGKKEELKKFYSLLSAEIDCTWDEFCWAYSNANGNNFGIKEKNNSITTCLVPLIDRLQVDLPNNNQTSLIYDTAKDGFILTAKKTILQNRRIFISTDNMPNQFFLLNQGIVFDNNPYDTVEINLFFNDFDPLINLRKGILKSEDEPFVFKLKGNFMLENIGKFLALLRIIEASQKEELKHDLLFYVQHAISLGSEKKSNKEIRDDISKQIKEF